MTTTSHVPAPWADVTDADALKALIAQSPGVIILAFENRDCAHCREHRRLLQAAWRHLDLPLTTLRVDATRLPILAEKYRILGYPTLLVFIDGQLGDRVLGRPDPSDLLDRLEPLLSAGSDRSAHESTAITTDTVADSPSTTATPAATTSLAVTIATATVSARGGE